jgi:hypothetical protein
MTRDNVHPRASIIDILEGNEHDQTRGCDWPDQLEEAAFHGLTGEIVHQIEPHSESDPAAVLSQFLISFGNLIGRRAHFIAESDRHFLNLFGVVVGQTSKARKGSSFGHLRHLFQATDAQWALDRITSGLSTGEGLIFAVRDPVYSNVLNKEKGRVTDCQRVMTDEGVDDKRLLVVEPEFARVLQVSDRSENTLSAILRESWDTGDLRVLTRKETVTATHAHISLIGHITQGELKRLLTDTAAANGFANRFLWICARRSKYLPEGGQFHMLDVAGWTRKIAEAAAFARNVGVISRDEHARRLWAEVYPALSEGKPGLLGSVTSRAEAITMRLACIYALLDKSEIIYVEHLRAALAVWKYADASAAFIFGDAVGDPVADEIRSELRRHPGGMTRTEIREYFSRNRSGAEIHRALGVLQEFGLAHMSRRDSTGGRPEERWFAT